MALLPKRPSADPSPISPLADHREYLRLTTLHRALSSARDDRRRGLDLLAIDAELARPATSSQGPRILQLRDRAARLRAAAPAPKADAPAADGLPPAVARALVLIRGEALEAEPDRTERLKTLRTELATIEKALIAVAVLMDDVRAEQSLAVAKQLAPQHKEILRTIHAAAIALVAAIEAERRLFAVPLAAGYDGRPDILHRPALDGASRLGSLADQDSQINGLTRRLNDLGVL
jgi:hypothetical protein